MLIRPASNLRSLYATGASLSLRGVGALAMLLATSILSAGTAKAGPLGVASDYNVFILGNDTQSNTDAEGKVAVGGNATFSSYSVASKLPTNTPNALVVGQNVTFTNGSVNGELHYGGSASLTNVGIGAGAPIHDQPIDFTAAANSLTSLSNSLSQLSANGTYASNYGVTLTGTDANLDVFHLTTAQLAAANGFGLNIVVPNGATVVINVDGGTGSSLSLSNFGMKINGSADETNSQINKVLFNFSNVTTFTDSSVTILGSVLAPQTNVLAYNAHIDGTLIAANLGASGTPSTIEAHNYTFNGNFGSTAVPEPSSIALLGLSALGCGAFIRKQRRQAA